MALGSPIEVRSEIVRRLELDLIGPMADDEVLESRPSDVYLTGILWPLGERMGGEDDDGSAGEDEEDQSASSATVVGQQRPCTMGFSFATDASTDKHLVNISVRFATYRPLVEKSKDGKNVVSWTRSQYEFLLDEVRLPVNGSYSSRLEKAGLEPEVELHIRSLTTGSTLLSTVTLINRSKPAEPDRELIERLTLFQTQIDLKPCAGSRIVPRPPMPLANDGDEKSGRLLYRHCHDFAAGHQCSVAWESSGDQASQIRSSWMPQAEVPAYRETGDDVFKEIAASGFLEAGLLANVDNAELVRRLGTLTAAYTRWIADRTAELTSLDGENLITARSHLQTCQNVCERIQSGVEAIRRDKILLESFRLANSAMAIQHSWKVDPEGKPLKPLCWRPFQLGFILLAAESACRADAVDRETLDLLWFPTGGGKTEAYLAIIGMLAWYRRLSNKDPDAGAGNAAVMRYTLRLLTAQQFERAASLLLACELLRQGKTGPRKGKTALGKIPFSIGLWVGRDATPNKFAAALESKGRKDGSTAEQIDKCPCCGSPVRWSYDAAARSVNPYCENSSCALGADFGLWPFYTVDEDIYREKPTLLIGTVDKFAQLPFKNEMASLFGFGTDRTTDLIIQDELHLISGPLGTITGLYETAFDWLLKKNSKRPKVIGSTATIRRAEQQVRALFDRSSCQFPPPGISYDNSGFAVVDAGKAPRLYVGITTAGRSAKFAIQAVSGSVLHSGGTAIGAPDPVRDGYATLLCYFNSLRELGGAIVQMLDDVPDSMSLYASRRGETVRQLGLPLELTSRVSQKEILEILGELKRAAGDPDCVDVVLATNMVSVGVDVPRLGLMVVNGQPKTRSEYIQSTSRVGRSAFPGLVISILNAAKARDRSHYETFRSWHGTIYRDVEATSVTPFASRARDRALHAVLASMIRHGDPSMATHPDLARAPVKLLNDVVQEIERRIVAIDFRELPSSRGEIDQRLDDWDARRPKQYLNPYKPKESLLQYAETYARKVASGKHPEAAWSTMNTMRSVEPSTRFRMAEVLSSGLSRAAASASPALDPTAGSDPGARPAPRWRNRNA